MVVDLTNDDKNPITICYVQNRNHHTKRRFIEPIFVHNVIPTTDTSLDTPIVKNVHKIK